jgi:uncharacterized protein YqeY
MTLKEKLRDDLKTYLKAKDTVKLEVVRSILTAVKNLEVQKMKTADDDDVVQAIRQEAKKRREAIDLYKQAGRNDLAEKEEEELKVLETYLPQMLSEQQVRQIVRARVEEIKPSSVKERGKVMGALMQELKGKADGSLVGKILDEELEKFLNGG